MKELVIGIGRFPIRIRTDDMTLFSQATERYCGFQCESSDVLIELCIRRGAGMPGLQDVRFVDEGCRVRISRADFDAEYDPGTGQCVSTLSKIYSLDTLLRVLHTLLLAPEKGFLLHASSVVRRGRAFVFTGASGAGKTTISRLAPSDARLLSDEISYVLPGSDGFHAYGTPFYGEIARPGENISAPLAGVYFLVQGPENRIEEIPASAAATALFENILFFSEDKTLLNHIFNATCDLASTVPVNRLIFKPDTSVWDLF